MRRGALRIFFLWTAVFAVLLAAVAPTLTQAMQSQGYTDQVFVCTPSGSKWITSDLGASHGKSLPDGDHADGHCPYCSMHAPGMGMSPVIVDPVALPLSYALHWRYSATTPTLDFWANALSRGPPARA